MLKNLNNSIIKPIDTYRENNFPMIDNDSKNIKIFKKIIFNNKFYTKI